MPDNIVLSMPCYGCGLWLQYLARGRGFDAPNIEFAQFRLELTSSAASAL